MTSKCVLVIDDYDDCMSLIKSVLEYETDWRIVTASSGREGIAIAQSELPDVILLDIIMPDLNGLDVYQLLKLDITTCLIPIVFMTAIDPIGRILKLQIPKNVKVISKPFNIDQLSYQISKVLENDSYFSNSSHT
ncbi:MAG: response regulator [Waterburya sp.]